MATQTGLTDALPLILRDVPTITVDGVLGDVASGETVRITLAEIVLNTDEGAERPKVRPAITLAMTHESVRAIHEHLGGVISRLADAK